MSASDELNKIEEALRGDAATAQSFYAKYKTPILVGLGVLLGLALAHYL